jgi:hypothetical protein
MKNLVRWFGIGLANVGGLLLLAVAGMYFNSSRQLNRTYEFASESVTIPTNEQSIANGKKWVGIACADCHGADFSGTAMIDDPAIGHLDSANLTSGKGGVGSIYTDEDWIRALRHGVARMASRYSSCHRPRFGILAMKTSARSLPISRPSPLWITRRLQSYRSWEQWYFPTIQPSCM